MPSADRPGRSIVRRAALFSGAGDPPLGPLVEAARDLTRGGAARGIAYVSAGTTRHDFSNLNARAFESVGELRIVGQSSGWQPSESDRAIIEDVSLIYIAGGNTYLLAERLVSSGLFELIARRVDAGVPLLTFSAGTVLCGPTILTTNDWNVTGSRHFRGFGFVPVHLNVHFSPHDTAPDAACEERVDEFLALRGEPVLALEETASLRADGNRCVVASGVAWLFSPNADGPRRLTVGAVVTAAPGRPR